MKNTISYFDSSKSREVFINLDLVQRIEISENGSRVDFCYGNYNHYVTGAKSFCDDLLERLNPTPTSTGQAEGSEK